MPDNAHEPEPTGAVEPRRLVAEMAELVGGLAHELRNPLSTMMVNLKLLTEELEDLRIHPEDARRRALLKAGVLTHEAERLQALFDKFLHLTVPDRHDARVVDLNDVVRRLIGFFRPSAEDAGIEVMLDLASLPLPCDIDEKRLRQALLNILINAQQAMPDGGALRIATEATPGEAVLRVSDTGVGMAPEDRARVLRPFFSTKAGGHGLGLSITQRIVSEHGGLLSFDSVLDRGTTVTIRLPRAAVSANDRSD